MSMAAAVLYGGAYALPPVALVSEVRPVLDFEGSEDKTLQSFRDEVDIVKIVRRFGGPAALESVVGAPVPEAFGDFTGVEDFHTTLNRVRQAQEMFALLKPELREKFGNDPGRLLEYLRSSDNVKEAVELGILAETALDAPVVAAAAPKGEEAPAVS